nr:hypothetical protein [uncultured Macellibacteroides sp.]
MEIEELKLMWKQYDERLDKLEMLNKKVIQETLLKKSYKKINWQKFKSSYSLIATPIILLIALHPNFKMENINWIFITGCIMVISVLIYVSFISLKWYIMLKNIHLDADSIISSTKKVATFSKWFNVRWKYVFLYYPVIFLGAVLIGWNSFNFTPNMILFLIGIFAVTFLLNIKGSVVFRKKIEKLEKEIQELDEYIR